MKAFFALLLLYTFFSSLLFSQEIFLDQNWERTKGLYSRTKSYCHPLKEGGKFCQKASLSYPVLLDAPDKKIQNAVADIVRTAVREYRRSDLKKSVIQNINEESYQPQGTWENNNALDLFTVTPKTFTMKNEGSGYTGGVHGYFSVEYDNYTHEGKHLTLNDLFKKDHNTTLYRIAEKSYKNSVGLKENESLEKDGWFSNTFTLSTNFAITDSGLLFHYNSYEIKPYAAGHTTFILPYSAIRSIIDPNGPLRPYLKQTGKLKRTFNNDDIARLSLTLERLNDSQLKIVVRENIWMYSKQNWLSLSFPQLKSKEALKISVSKGFRTTHIYPAGSKIYHNVRKKALRSKYLLVEGESGGKDNTQTKQITLLVTLPSSLKEFTIQLRAAFKNGRSLKTMPSPYEGVKGQQGFGNYLFHFPLE